MAAEGNPGPPTLGPPDSSALPVPIAVVPAPLVIAPPPLPDSIAAGGTGGNEGPTANVPATMEVQEVKPEPQKRRGTLFTEAQRLATLPRTKYSEFTQAAFWSALVSLTGGIAGLDDLLREQPLQPKLLDIALILIFGISAAITVLGVSTKSDIETSGDYLNTLYNVTPPSSKPRRRWFFLWLN